MNIGEPELKTIVNHRDGSNGDIIKTIERAFPDAVKSVKEYAHQFKGKDLYESGSNVWNYLKNNISYEADGRNQKILMPRRLAHCKIGDCKSFALFSASILYSLGYNVKFRYTSYNSLRTPTHIYTIASDNKGNEIICDAVWYKYNEEKSYTHKIDHKMQISTLSGIGTAEELTTEELIRRIKWRYSQLEKYREGTSERAFVLKRINILEDLLKRRTGTAGIGAPQKNKEKGRGGRAVKKIALSVPRASLLTLLKLNARGIAKRFSFSDQDKLKKLWAKLGGKESKLMEAIEKGKNKKPLLGESKKNKALKGIGFAPAIPVLLASATALLTAFKSIMPPSKDGDDSIELAVQEGLNNGGDGSVDLTGEDVEIVDKGSGADHGFSPSPMMIGVGLAVVVGGYLMMKK